MENSEISKLGDQRSTSSTTSASGSSNVSKTAADLNLTRRFEDPLSKPLPDSEEIDRQIADLTTHIRNIQDEILELSRHAIRSSSFANIFGTDREHNISNEDIDQPCYSSNHRVRPNESSINQLIIIKQSEEFPESLLPRDSGAPTSDDYPPLIVSEPLEDAAESTFPDNCNYELKPIWKNFEDIDGLDNDVDNNISNIEEILMNHQTNSLVASKVKVEINNQNNLQNEIKSLNFSQIYVSKQNTNEGNVYNLNKPNIQEEIENNENIHSNLNVFNIEYTPQDKENEKESNDLDQIMQENQRNKENDEYHTKRLITDLKTDLKENLATVKNIDIKKSIQIAVSKHSVKSKPSRQSTRSKNSGNTSLSPDYY